jgi:hypothetical protein
MNVDMSPEIIHDEVPGFHSISELSAKPEEESYLLIPLLPSNQDFYPQEVPPRRANRHFRSRRDPIRV